MDAENLVYTNKMAFKSIHLILFANKVKSLI